MTFSITMPNKMTLGIMTQVTTKLSKMTLSMVTRSKTVQEVLLGAVMLIVAMLSVVMLSVVMLIVIMLSVVMLSVVMLNVVVTRPSEASTAQINILEDWWAVYGRPNICHNDTFLNDTELN